MIPGPSRRGDLTHLAGERSDRSCFPNHRFAPAPPAAELRFKPPRNWRWDREGRFSDAFATPGIRWIEEAEWVRVERCEPSTPPLRALRRSNSCPTAVTTWQSPTPEAATAVGAIWRSPAGERMPRAIAGELLFIC